MIQTIDRSRAGNALQSVLQQCCIHLQPKLRQLLNPNVVDAFVRLQLHFGNGALNHIREADSKPAYVDALKESGEDNPTVGKVLKQCIATLHSRLLGRVGADCHGIVTLNVAISGGQATISSEADWVHKPSVK
jgi:hypothetical protein